MLQESSIFSSLRKAQNLDSSRGLVKISASCFFGAHMVNFDISFGFVVSQEMMSDVYVLGSRVVYGIVCKLNGTLIVT